MTSHYTAPDNLVATLLPRRWTSPASLNAASSGLRSHWLRRDKPQPVCREPPDALEPPPPMLVGTCEHPVAGSGAARLPLLFHPVLRAGCVMTGGFDGCLHVLPLHDWHTMAQRLCSAAPASSEARVQRRQWFALAAHVQPDEQGDMIIPANLRAYAAIGEQAVFVGLYTYVELWSRERWERTLETL